MCPQSWSVKAKQQTGNTEASKLEETRVEHNFKIGLVFGSAAV
jgi:hypothetical protein